MKSYGDMTYDEQRAFLGLPDVRAAVAWYRIGASVRQIADGLRAFGESIRAATRRVELFDDDDYVLAGEK